MKFYIFTVDMVELSCTNFNEKTDACTSYGIDFREDNARLFQKGMTIRPKDNFDEIDFSEIGSPSIEVEIELHYEADNPLDAIDMVDSILEKYGYEWVSVFFVCNESGLVIAHFGLDPKDVKNYPKARQL